jgi:hypothetical protein
MTTYLDFQLYLSHFFLELEMFQTRLVEKIKTHFVHNNIFFLIWCRLRDNVKECCRGGQATYDNIALAHACWIPKATNTHS